MIPLVMSQFQVDSDMGTWAMVVVDGGGIWTTAFVCRPVIVNGDHSVGSSFGSSTETNQVEKFLYKNIIS